MSNENETPRLVDPLDENVNDIDTSYPRIPIGLYDLTIKEVKIGPNKKNTGEKLELLLATTVETIGTNGETISPGLIIRHHVGVTPHPIDESGKEYTIEQVKKSIASIAQSAGVSCTVREIITNYKMLEGKVVRCKVGIDKETSEFPEKNNIRAFLVVK